MNDAINSFSAWYVATQALKLRDSDLETAVQLLGQVLETRNKAYGENALECADTYLYYGQCLFEQAQVGTCCSWSAAGVQMAASAAATAGQWVAPAHHEAEAACSQFSIIDSTVPVPFPAVKRGFGIAHQSIAARERPACSWSSGTIALTAMGPGVLCMLVATPYGCVPDVPRACRPPVTALGTRSRAQPTSAPKP
jgi:hypothetical protein